MKRFLIFIAAIFVFVGLSACQKEPDPAIAVQEGINALIDAKKSSFEVKTNGVSAGANGPMEFSIVLSGKSDSGKTDDIKADLTLDGEIKTAGKTAKIKLDFRTLDRISYVRLNSMELPDTRVAQEALDQFLQKWWEMPSQGEQSFLESLTADQEKFLKVVKENPLFTNIRFVGEEEVRNSASRKYQADINKETLQKILEILPALEGEAPVGDADKAALTARLQEVDFSGNIWVEKDDDAVHRIAGTLRIAPKDGDPASFDIEMEAWDFGNDVVVEKPADAEPFNPVLLLGLVSSLLPQNQTVAPATPSAVPSEPIDQPLGAKQAK